MKTNMRGSPLQTCLLMVILFTVVNLASAQPWNQTSAPSEPWKSIACSADGIKLVAAGFSITDGMALQTAPIYTSTNAGLSWAQTTDQYGSWISVASSADGANLVAAASAPDGHFGNHGISGMIYVSHDSGVTWTQTSAPNAPWISVASSADGTKLVGVVGSDVPSLATGDGSIYVSSDSGVTWNHCTVPTNNWGAVASSADGIKLIAVAGGYGNILWGAYQNPGPIYVSQDSGTTWRQTTAPSNYWGAVACSADATTIAVGGALASTFISVDAGAIWTSAGVDGVNALACSADGSTIMAGSFISTNSGSTWEDIGGYGPLCISADGKKIVAPSYGTWPYTEPWRLTLPVLSITSLSENAVVSWLVPSSSFVLQETSDLSTTNWTDMLTSPSLNSTNLNYQVTVSPTNGQGFYRLKQK